MASQQPVSAEGAYGRSTGSYPTVDTAHHVGGHHPAAADHFGHAGWFGHSAGGEGGTASSASPGPTPGDVFGNSFDESFGHAGDRSTATRAAEDFAPAFGDYPAPAGHETPDSAPFGAPTDGGPAAESPRDTEAVWYGPEAPAGEWNPGADPAAPVRGRHRVARRRGGTVARSRAVLGVGVIAAVGAGGMASAQEGVEGSGADRVRAIPDRIPGLSALLSTDDQDAGTTRAATPVITAAPLTSAGVAVASADSGTGGSTDPGEALRSRILQQADTQEAIVEAERHAELRTQAVAAAAEEAAELAERERLEAEERERAEEERKRKEEEERKRKEEEERLRQLRESYVAPLTSYSFSSGYGVAGAMWASGYHTGTDLVAPAGTPIKNIHTGVVKEAAWAGSYGYRVVVELADGTEVSYSHLSSMAVVAGQEVITGEVIGNVGSTGNSTGPHLHLEVQPAGSGTVDPVAWMRGKGVAI
ncbi:M23 family metallopeptidase [Streptomyces alkaliphilus]|uniref:M23 family metallopeptidase n=1 Tax=Streptomyces alkaliphilus TaxID=1472722 RepID=UPI002B206F1D|nr:M23 family metallopeptidase [Streptomyces alkaliphilus]